MAGDITFGDFVLVKYNGPKSVKYFVGRVEDIDQNHYEISFLKRSIGNTFTYPEVLEVDKVTTIDVEMMLPKPKASGSTKRSCSVLIFPNVSFGKYNMG